MIVARYTSSVSGYVPTFNDGYAYSVNEQLNNGVYTVEIESDTDFSSVIFGTNGDNDVTSLLSVEYLKITNKVYNLQYCFRRCTNVTSINTDGWDTSNVTTLQQTFQNCTALTTLDVSKWYTGNVNTLYQTFHGCSTLTSLDVSGWNTGKVTTLQQTFYNCLKLTSLDLSEWITSNVTTLQSTFLNCYALTSLDVSGWNTGKVTTLQQTFQNCTALTSLDLSGWDTKNITSLQSTFRDCTALASLYLSGWVISNVTTLLETFRGCSALTSLDVSGWDTKNVTSLRATFYNCSTLTSLDVSGWNTGKVNTLYATFSHCSKLTSLDVSGWDISKVTTLYTTFSYCSKLTSLNVSGWVTSNVDNLYATFQNCSALTSLDVSGWDTSNVTNLETTFAYCSALTSLDVSGWNTGKVTTLQQTFQNCSALTSLNVSKWDISNATSLESTFLNCSALTSLDVSGWNTGKVTTLRSTFHNCSKLTSLDVSEWDTGKVNTLYATFQNCSALTSLDVSGWNTGKVTTLQQTFQNCSVKSIGVLYCSDNTITKLANAITTQCDFYLDRININSPNSLVNFIKYKECKKEVIYYDSEDNSWKKPVLREWDSIEKHSNGKYYYHKRSGEVVLNGSEEWTKDPDLKSENTSRFKMTLKDGNYKDSLVACYNIPIDSNDNWHSEYFRIDLDYLNALGINLENNKLSTTDVAGFKAWLQANPTTVVYQLAEEKVYECTNLDLISYADETNLMVESGAIPHITTLKNHQNITNITTILQEKVNVLENNANTTNITTNSNTTQIDNLSKELQKINNLEESVISEVVSESENGLITVENTNNGYFEDVKLEGKTLVNLADIQSTFKETCDYWYIIHTLCETSKLKLNEPYTLVIYCNYLSGHSYNYNVFELGVGNSINDFTSGLGLSLNTNAITMPTSGVYTHCLEFKNFSNKPYLACRPCRRNNAPVSGEIANYDVSVLLLEGDHTQNLPGFFEGIKSVGQDVDEINVLTCNENLFNGVWVDKYISNIGVQQHSSYVGTDYIDVMPSKTYTINCGIESINYFDKSKKYIGNANIPSNFYNLDSVTFTTPTNCRYIACRQYLSSSTVLSLEEINKLNIQIKQGNTADVFIKHRENKKRILYYNDETQTWEKPILRQWDSIEKHADGKYYYHQRSGGLVLDGSEDWRDYGSDAATESSKCFYMPTSITRPYRGLYMCDRLKFGVYNASLGQISDITETINSLYFNTDVRFTDYVYIRINISLLESPDVSGFKAWLQANNVTVVYQLAEEKVYECTDLDLISYADETNLMAESGAVNPKVSLKVSNGVVNVVTLLQNKVTVLEQMVYNLMKMLNSQQSNIDE